MAKKLVVLTLATLALVAALAGTAGAERRPIWPTGIKAEAL